MPVKTKQKVSAPPPPVKPEIVPNQPPQNVLVAKPDAERILKDEIPLPTMVHQRPFPDYWVKDGFTYFNDKKPDTRNKLRHALADDTVAEWILHILDPTDIRIVSLFFYTTIQGPFVLYSKILYQMDARWQIDFERMAELIRVPAKQLEHRINALSWLGALTLIQESDPLMLNETLGRKIREGVK